MKLCTLAYLPPRNVGHVVAFKENLDRFPTRYDLLTYSDDHWGDSTVRLRGSPEGLKGCEFPNGQVNKFGMQNAAFFTGLYIAKLKGYTHALLLEADCRVGRAHYDERVFEEFFNIGRPLAAAGTLVCQNPCNFSGEGARRWASLVAHVWTKHRRPVATYGWLGGNDQQHSNLFPNGALAVYDLHWMAKLFNLDQAIETARTHTAFDMALGIKLWDHFGPDAFEVLGYLDSVYSGYGDILNTEDERLALLGDKIVAVHQVKSAAQPKL